MRARVCFICLKLVECLSVGISLTLIACRPRKTKEFLCRLEDNHVGIEFLEFTIQDYDTKRVIFHVDRDSSAVPDFDTSANFDVDQLRRIDYKFESDVLMLPRVQTKCVIGIAPEWTEMQCTHNAANSHAIITAIRMEVLPCLQFWDLAMPLLSGQQRRGSDAM